MSTTHAQGLSTNQASRPGPDRQEPGDDVRLSAAEEAILGRALPKDCSLPARERLIVAHSHLVVAIAHKYAGRGLPAHVLVEAGQAGLLQAVDHFDPADGARFSTGASWWIKHAIRQALAKAALGSEGPRAVPGRHQTPLDGRSNQVAPTRGGAILPPSQASKAFRAS